MAADFDVAAQHGRRCGQAVENIALAWLPEEAAKLTNEVMVQAAMLYLEGRGIAPATTQWALVRHHDQEHPHCHLILNRVTDDGQVLPDKRSHRRSAEACRKVEAAMGFVDAAQLGATEKLRQAVEGELPSDVAERVQCKHFLRQALEKHLPTATTIQELQAGLAKEGVRMQATLQQGGQLQAVVFKVDAYPGLHVKGSEVAREYSGVGLRKALAAQAESQEAAMTLAARRPHLAVPAVPEPPAALPPTPLARHLPVAPRPVVAALAEGSVGTEVALPEAGKHVPPAPMPNRTPSVSLPERNVQPPVPVSEAVRLPEVTAPTADHSSLGRVIPADPPVAVPLGEAVIQPLRSAPAASTQAAAIPPGEVLLTGPFNLPANAVGTAPIVGAEASWQHGIIRMLATEKGSSEARLSRVRAGLVAAGATVGEIVPPTLGRHTAALLAYSFDPASTKLEEVNQVLRAAQAACDSNGVSTSKVQERQHPWHQPGVFPDADALKWPEREGQFNQAQILVDDPVRGQLRADKVANELRSVGASVSTIKRDNQGRLSMRVRYHTCTPHVDAIDTVLAKVAASSATGIEVKESPQNKDARWDGVMLVAMRQKENDASMER
jgi:hypothetical protein